VPERRVVFAAPVVLAVLVRRAVPVDFVALRPLAPVRLEAVFAVEEVFDAARFVPVAARPFAALLLAAVRVVPVFAVLFAAPAVRDFVAAVLRAAGAFAARVAVPVLLRVLPVALLRPVADFAAPRVEVAPFVALIVFGEVFFAAVDFLAAGAPAAFEVFVVMAMMLSRDL
jgi:hypothetical protein